MCILVTRNGTRIYYKDWSLGQPVVFAHGWPLTADAWDSQMMFMGTKGYRVIAHDRRGHGRSEQTWDGNDMDTYADDLAALLDALDLREVILVGHSTGSGEAVRYIARHGSSRIAKLVLVSTITPLMIQTPTNPRGTPIDQFEEIRAKVLRDRSQLFKDLSVRFYNANRPSSTVLDGLRTGFWRQGMLAGVKPVHDCIAAFSETDFHDDLRTIDVPTLLVHGDDDQVVALESARISAELIPDASLQVYAGASHGLPQTHADRLNHDLLAFAKR